MIKLLLFSSLFPNSQQPTHGVFVENRLRKLQVSGKVEVKVVAPISWFPFKNEIFGSYGRFARVPKYETRYGNDLFHPRYLVIPKIGMNLTPKAMVKASLPIIKNIIDEGFDFDVIDAHYFYPDGVAAVEIGKILGKPVVVTARGSDINLITDYEKPKEMITIAAKNADAVITVSNALKEKIISLGVEDEKVNVLRNGVDLNFFTPAENRDCLKEKLQLKGKAIISVGNLVELKGHHLVIEAMKKIPECNLVIIGDGSMMSELKQKAVDEDVEERVKFLGRLSQEELRDYYRAADLLVLASSREGWPNVLLESLACDTPVIATNVGGSPELLRNDNVGGIIQSRDPDSIANATNKIFENYPEASMARKFAESYSWDSTTDGQLQIFKRLKQKGMPVA